MSKKKDVKRAEAGVQFRGGRQVSKEEATKIDENSRLLSGLRSGSFEVTRELLLHKPVAPDLRCPECNSSRMSKEGLNHCPECAYVGKPVDVTRQEAKPPDEEQGKKVHDA